MSIEEFNKILARQFDKAFVLSGCGDEVEKTSDEINVDSSNDILNRLLAIEERLNSVKMRIERTVKRHGGNNLSKWRSHTKFNHTLKDLPKHILEGVQQRSLSESAHSLLWTSLYTQAYCKFMELIIAYPELIACPSSANINNNDFRTLHLCEAPGAFVCALRDALYGKLGNEKRLNSYWHWWMNSLNSGLPLDNAIMNDHAENMIFSPTGSGDIFEWNEAFIDAFLEKAGGKFALVTADGSVDCTEEPASQEASVRKLLAQEVSLGLRCVAVGGNFVLKAFTFLNVDTITQVLIPLLRNFQHVVCRKPAASKPGNSEVYLVCFYRIKTNGEIHNDKTLSPKLLELKRIVDCADFFAQCQLDYMQFNLRTFCRWSQSERAAISIQKCAVVEYMAGKILEKIRPDFNANGCEIKNITVMD